jgi:poly-beta-1,6-N-acetyl-D-glucosamine biosynthesis protein PgaD
MWLVYLYLIRDAFIDLYTLVDQVARWIFLHAPRPYLPSMFGLMETLGDYAVVIVLNGAILIGWALYNQIRFRGRDSRKAIAAVSPADLGKFHGFSDADVTRWQQARTLLITHDADGKVLAVTPPPANPPHLGHGVSPLLEGGSAT